MTVEPNQSILSNSFLSVLSRIIGMWLFGSLSNLAGFRIRIALDTFQRVGNNLERHICSTDLLGNDFP